MRSVLTALLLVVALTGVDMLDGAPAAASQRPRILAQIDPSPAADSICGKMFFCSYVMICRTSTDAPPTATRSLFDVPVCRQGVSTVNEARVVWAGLVHAIAARPPSCVVLCHDCADGPSGACRSAAR